MRDPDEMRELEAVGEDEDLEEDWQEPPQGESGGGGASLLQAVLCALALIALVFFKVTDPARYQEIAEWYRGEMAQEIELPKIMPAAPTPSPSPSPEPTPTPSPDYPESPPPENL